MEKEIQFDGFKKPDEPVPVWLQRVLSKPYSGIDKQDLQSKVDEITKAREERNSKLLQDLNAACLDLHAWASARPTVEHARSVSLMDSKVLKASQQSAEQERLREQLLQFAQTIHGAMSLLLQSRQPSQPQKSVTGEQVGEPGQDVGAGREEEASPAPTVLAPNSSPV